MGNELFEAFDNVLANAAMGETGGDEPIKLVEEFCKIFAQRDYSVYDLDQLARRLEKTVEDWKEWVANK